MRFYQYRQDGRTMSCTWTCSDDSYFRCQYYHDNPHHLTPADLEASRPSYEHTRHILSYTEERERAKRKGKWKRDKKEHTTPEIRWSSPIQLLVWHFAACVQGSGRHPQYSYEPGTSVQRMLKMEACEPRKWDARLVRQGRTSINPGFDKPR